MHKQTSYVLLPVEGEPLAFSSKKEAEQKKKELKGSTVYDAVVYTDDSLNTNRKEN